MENEIKYNGSGYYDPTPYEAIKNIEDEIPEERLRKLLKAVFTICDLAGFTLECRLVLKDKKTGKVWR